MIELTLWTTATYLGFPHVKDGYLVDGWQRQPQRGTICWCPTKEYVSWGVCSVEPGWVTRSSLWSTMVNEGIRYWW